MPDWDFAGLTVRKGGFIDRFLSEDVPTAHFAEIFPGQQFTVSENPVEDGGESRSAEFIIRKVDTFN